MAEYKAGEEAEKLSVDKFAAAMLAYKQATEGELFTAREKVYNDAYNAYLSENAEVATDPTAEEIAAAAVYFASDDSAYTTGQILTVSGGFGLATPVYGDLSDKLNRR